MGLGLVMGLVCIYFFISSIYRLLQSIFAPFKPGKTYRCKVLKVYDGDTITVRRLNLRRSQTSIRMAYIDAPEIKQTYGNESRETLQGYVLDRWVKVTVIQKDKYGRYVAEVRRGRQYINALMVQKGAAWAYPDYIRSEQQKKEWLGFQQHAKQKKRGLWNSRSPQAPQAYRRQS